MAAPLGFSGAFGLVFISICYVILVLFCGFFRCFRRFGVFSKLVFMTSNHGQNVHLVVSSLQLVISSSHFVISNLSSQLAASSSQLAVSSSQLAVSSSQLVFSSHQLVVQSCRPLNSSFYLVIFSPQLVAVSSCRLFNSSSRRVKSSPRHLNLSSRRVNSSSRRLVTILAAILNAGISNVIKVQNVIQFGSKCNKGPKYNTLMY